MSRSEYAKQWRLDNPDKVAAGIERSKQRRKEKWEQFLQAERDRYAADPSKKAAQQQKRISSNPEGRKEIVRRSYEKNKHKFVSRVAKRKASKLQATPSWADLSKIEEFYELARHLSATTGAPHEVDHIYPLRGKSVCGLHVHTNLRVTTRGVNRAKGAKLDESFTP